MKLIGYMFILEFFCNRRLLLFSCVKNLFRVLVLQVLLVGGELVGSERELTASYLTMAPNIDGKLDDNVWKNGVWFTDFTLISNPKKLAEVQTEFQIAYDDENLYLAARMCEPESGRLKIEEFRRDGSIGQDDSLELMLDPACDRYAYFHFSTNTVGIQYDAKQSLGGEFHDIEWNASWKVATKIASKEWTLEMAIPLAELTLRKESGGEWGFNVVRQRRAGNNRETSSFSPMKGSFHMAQKFSKLNFQEEKFGKFFWKIKRPFDYHIEADKGDWILTGKVQIKNEGSENGKIKLIFKQIKQRGAMVAQVITDELLLGREKEYGFRLPVERQEPLELQIEIVNVDNVKEVYRLRRTLLDVSYKSMKLDLISPWYRNSIYPSESIAELKLLVRLALAPKVLAGSKLSLRLIGEKTKNVVSHLELENLSNVQEVHLPLGDIAVGEYIIEAQIIDSREDIVAKSTEVLKKLRQEENEWRLDSNRNLLHNGKAFLPQGWFKILPGETQMASSMTFNALFLSMEVMEDEERIKKYLDSIQKANAYAVIYPYLTEEMISSPKHVGRLLTTTEVKMMQQRVKNLKKHPALMAWIIADQPEIDSVLPARIKQVYAIISEEDPFHPVVIVNSNIKGITQYEKMADITMATFIPFMQGEVAVRPIDSVSYYLDVANKAAGKKVPLWFGFQAYAYGDDWSETVHLLKFVELRNMFYQAVINGVKGFFWHDYRYIYNYPEIKIGADYLARELNLLKNAIFAPKVNEKMNIQSVDKHAIYASHKMVDRDHYVFAVNTGYLRQTVQFETSLLKGIDKLYVLAENRIVKVNDGQFSDNFDPYATHIYSTKEFKDSLGLLSDVEKSIDLANKAKKKGGNLAFSDNGMKIVASSYSKLSSINNINDGVFEGLTWISKESEPLPQWIELSWPEAICIGKVVIYSDTIEQAKVQINQDGDWVDIGDFVRQSGAHLRARFPERDLQKIRILITEKKPGTTFVNLSEIEVYNPLTKGLNISTSVGVKNN